MLYCIPFPHKRHANAAVTGRRKNPLCLYGLKSNGALAFYNRFVAPYTVKNVELILTHTHEEEAEVQKGNQIQVVGKEREEKSWHFIGMLFSVFHVNWRY